MEGLAMSNFKVSYTLAFSPEGSSPTKAPRSQTWAGLTKADVRALEDQFMSVIGALTAAARGGQKMSATNPQTATFTVAVTEGDKPWTGPTIFNWPGFGDEAQAVFDKAFADSLAIVGKRVHGKERQRR